MYRTRILRFLTHVEFSAMSMTSCRMSRVSVARHSIYERCRPLLLNLVWLHRERFGLLTFLLAFNLMKSRVQLVLGVYTALAASGTAVFHMYDRCRCFGVESVWRGLLPRARISTSSRPGAASRHSKNKQPDAQTQPSSPCDRLR